MFSASGSDNEFCSQKSDNFFSKKHRKNFAKKSISLSLHSLTETDREVLKDNDIVAQLVEQYTFNVWVLGSSPNGITKPRKRGAFFILWHLFIFCIHQS